MSKTLTIEPLRDHVGHSVHVQLVRRKPLERLRTASGNMDVIRDGSLSLIDRNDRERQIAYAEIEYLGCSTDGWSWPGNITVQFTPEQATAVLYALADVAGHSNWTLGHGGVTGGKAAISEIRAMLRERGAKDPVPYDPERRS